MGSKKKNGKAGLGPIFGGKKRISSVADTRAPTPAHSGGLQTESSSGDTSSIQPSGFNGKISSRNAQRPKPSTSISSNSSSAYSDNATSRQAFSFAPSMSTQAPTPPPTRLPESSGALTQPLMTHGGFAAALGFNTNASYSVSQHPFGASSVSAVLPTSASSLPAIHDDTNNKSTSRNSQNTPQGTPQTSPAVEPPTPPGASMSAAGVNALPQVIDGTHAEAHDGAPDIASGLASCTTTGFNRSPPSNAKQSPCEGGLMSMVGGMSSASPSAVGIPSTNMYMASGGFANVFSQSHPAMMPNPPSGNRPNGSNGRRVVFTASEAGSSSDPGVQQSTPEQTYSRSPTTHPVLGGFGSSFSDGGENRATQSPETYLRSTNFLRGTSPSKSALATSTADATSNTSVTENVMLPPASTHPATLNSSLGGAFSSRTHSATPQTSHFGLGSVAGMSFHPSTESTFNLMSVSLGGNASTSTAGTGRGYSVSGGMPMQVAGSFMTSSGFSGVNPSAIPYGQRVPMMRSIAGAPSISASLSANTATATPATDPGTHTVVTDEAADTRQALESLSKELTQCLEKSLEIAQKIRAAGGNSTLYGFVEKKTAMSLYDHVGLDEDPDEGHPTHFQRRLQRYRFPPPHMEKLRSMETADEDTLVFMIGKREARRRERNAIKTQEALARSRNEPVPPFNEAAVLAEYTLRQPKLTIQNGENDTSAIVTSIAIDRKEEIGSHRRQAVLIAQPYGVDSDDSDLDLNTGADTPHNSFRDRVSPST